MDVTVTAPGGVSAVTATDQFSYVPLPAVAGLSPNTGPKAGGTAVTVTGSGFALGTTLTTFLFGTTKATSVNCTSTTECTLVAPPHAVGTVDVKVTVNKLVSLAEPLSDQYTYN